jgi:hypothetical protein
MINRCMSDLLAELARIASSGNMHDIYKSINASTDAVNGSPSLCMQQYMTCMRILTWDA